jgi:hypothetical protein
MTGRQFPFPFRNVTATTALFRLLPATLLLRNAQRSGAEGQPIAIAHSLCRAGLHSQYGRHLPAPVPGGSLTALFCALLTPPTPFPSSDVFRCAQPRSVDIGPDVSAPAATS